jgi:hypothetical protein
VFPSLELSVSPIPSSSARISGSAFRRLALFLEDAALTDHRILRIPSENPPMAAAARESTSNLIYRTAPLEEPDAKPDLRALALAYYEVSQVYPTFRQKGFEVLEQAAQELPKRCRGSGGLWASSPLGSPCVASRGVSDFAKGD